MALIAMFGEFIELGICTYSYPLITSVINPIGIHNRKDDFLRDRENQV